MIRRVHVNRHVIARNRKTGEREPALRVKTYKANVACNEAVFTGEARVVYRPDKPLSCGAVAWVESDHPVIADGKKV